MSNPRMVIVGGGLAGLSAGCFARLDDFDVTIVEHNPGLGGVCTAWHRGAYLADGCIHWLTGGPFIGFAGPALHGSGQSNVIDSTS